jgi:hypothetical protein
VGLQLNSRTYDGLAVLASHETVDSGLLRPSSGQAKQPKEYVGRLFHKLANPAYLRIQFSTFLSSHVLLISIPLLLHAQAPPQPGLLPDAMSPSAALTAGQKFNTRVVQSFGVRGFAGAAIGAAIGQARDSPHEWGQGAEGFGRRYGSGFGGNFSRQVFAFTLESVLHEDPRYLPSVEGTNKKRRVANALKQVIFTRTDDGGATFAYGRVISAFSAAELTNVWQPRSTGKQSSAVIRTLVGFGGDAAFNCMQEFLPFLRSGSLRHRH